ncbi:MAG: hypothetical protein CFE21_10150 [Bacteroidetes bacterium B1(2017)]|nr:MAG: hypothetical protein CFE21_10150 [Bacteroidetes bacterium B1(2017)]
MIKTELKSQLDVGIKLLELAIPTASDFELYSQFEEAGVFGEHAFDFFVFIPVLFCKTMLPSVPFPDSYFEIKNGETIKRSFKSTILFTRLKKEIQTVFIEGISQETVLKVAGRSSNFRVINEVLLEGYNLGDIVLSPITIHPH